ncbi:MAG: hypothetical protein OEW92_06995 [Gammaproteobacteria bacterium]|jgi:hypothetical protein|nr:hypothetical protein [Gammaproteobacteria bacterium]
MKSNLSCTAVSCLLTALILAACSQDTPPANPAKRSAGDVFADDIPIANTPPGGYGNAFPPPVLAECTEPLVDGAPDLRGIWKAVHVERDGQPAAADDRLYHYVERIEQCGNRIVDMGGGTIADGRADGTAENGIHDVLVFDYTTPIHVIVTYEEGKSYVLQPMLVSAIAKVLPSINIPWQWLPLPVPGLKVTRTLESDGHMRWQRPDRGFTMTLERIGGPNDPYTRKDLPDSTTGGNGLPPDK